jgi:hypothetical protein
MNDAPVDQKAASRSGLGNRNCPVSAFLYLALFPAGESSPERIAVRRRKGATTSQGHAKVIGAVGVHGTLQRFVG